jgi:putative ABC transport system permease protein
MRILSLALRNLTRNKRRTLVTALAVAFGTTAIVSLQGFVNGFLTNLIEASVEAKVGAIQVFRRGYLGSDDPLKLSLADDAALVARIRAVAGVTAVAPRLAFDGMVSNGSEATMFVATAIDPALEYQVCPQRRAAVAAGSRALEPGQNDRALIGKTLADALGAKAGATLVMQSAGPHASTNALDVVAGGFLPTHSMAESKRMATVTLAFAQELLRMPGRVTQYVVGVADLERVDETAARVRAVLGGDYEVTTWREMDPATRDRTGALRYILLFVALVLFLLVATGIVNTMLMSVYERVREIGTMLAVGVRRRQVTALFLWEAVALGLSSALVGAAAGLSLVRGLGQKGLAIRPPGGDVTVIHPYVDPAFLVMVVALAVAGTVVAAFYPAWKASRLRPVEALRAT